jgi:hypothetical protein
MYKMLLGLFKRMLELPWMVDGSVAVAFPSGLVVCSTADGARRQGLMFMSGLYRNPLEDSVVWTLVSPRGFFVTALNPEKRGIFVSKLVGGLSMVLRLQRWWLRMRREARKLVLAMALHPRLGHGAGIECLGADLLNLIGDVGLRGGREGMRGGANAESCGLGPRI